MKSTWMICHNNTNVTSVQEFYECYDSMIFKKDELIFGSYYWDYINWKSPDLQIEWDELSYSMMYGKCQLARDIGEIEETKFVKLKLNDSLEYRVWIHDPNFFFMSWNPRSTPSLLAKLKFNKIDRNHIIQYISKEKNSLLNTEKAKIVHHSYFFLHVTLFNLRQPKRSTSQPPFGPRRSTSKAPFPSSRGQPLRLLFGFKSLTS